MHGRWRKKVISKMQYTKYTYINMFIFLNYISLTDAGLH